MMSLSPRKAAILRHAEDSAGSRRGWREKASAFHREDEAYLKFLIPKGKRVLEIGCGIGDTLASLEPSYGLGIDFSPGMIEQAKKELSRPFVPGR